MGLNNETHTHTHTHTHIRTYTYYSVRFKGVGAIPPTWGGGGAKQMKTQDVSSLLGEPMNLGLGVIADFAEYFSLTIVCIPQEGCGLTRILTQDRISSYIITQTILPGFGRNLV